MTFISLTTGQKWKSYRFEIDKTCTAIHWSKTCVFAPSL